MFPTGRIVYIKNPVYNLQVFHFQIQGIITRHNLTHEFLEERVEELNNMEELNEHS